MYTAVQYDSSVTAVFTMSSVIDVLSCLHQNFTMAMENICISTVTA